MQTGLILEMNLKAEQISLAVDAYINEKLSGLKTLQDDVLLRRQVRDILRRKANDTFLWVSFVVEELQRTASGHILQVVDQMPPGLTALYAQALSRIEQLPSRDSELCKFILSAASIVYRPLRLEELGGLSGFLEQISNSADKVGKMVAMCSPLLTVRDGQVHFVNKSAKDYLRTSAVTILNRATRTHRSLFTRSLELMSLSLRRDMYGLGTPGFPINEVRVPTPDPLAAVRYSCVHWVGHLVDSVGMRSNGSLRESDSRLVYTFFREEFLYWLEALSLIRSIPEGLVAIGRLEDLLASIGEHPMLVCLVQDAHRFLMCHIGSIEQAPLQAYASALVFSPRESLVRKPFKAIEPDWIMRMPAVEEGWSACLRTLEGHSDSVSTVAFLSNARVLASSSADRTIRIWDLALGRCIRKLVGYVNSLSSVGFSADARLLALADECTTRVWDSATSTCLQILHGHRCRVRSIAFSPDARLLASASQDSTIRIWESATGICLQELRGHSSWVRSVAFSPNGRLLASASDDCTIRVWDFVTAISLQVLHGHSHWVLSVAFSPDARLLASASEDCTIRIWDSATGICLQMLQGHSRRVRSVAFSSDVGLMASASDDRTIKIWDPDSGHCVQTLDGHSGSVRSVAFSPRGKQLVSASDDLTIRIWNSGPSSHPTR